MSVVLLKSAIYFCKGVNAFLTSSLVAGSIFTPILAMAFKNPASLSPEVFGVGLSAII